MAISNKLINSQTNKEKTGNDKTINNSKAVAIVELTLCQKLCGKLTRMWLQHTLLHRKLLSLNLFHNW